MIPVIPVHELCVQIANEERKYCRAIVKSVTVF